MAERDSEQLEIGTRVRFNLNERTNEPFLERLHGTVTASRMNFGNRTMIGVRWQDGKFSLVPEERLEVDEDTAK